MRTERKTDFREDVVKAKSWIPAAVEHRDKGDYY